MKLFIPTYTKSLFILLHVFLFMPDNALLAQTWTYQFGTGTSPMVSFDAVNDQVVWASGWNGIYCRTLDGGENWTLDTIPGGENIDMYSIVAFNADTAYLAGSGWASPDGRIYKTTDGGQNWVLQYQNTSPDIFFNNISFWDSEHGMAVSDQVDSTFVVLITADGGQNWNQVPKEDLPAPFSGEYAGWGNVGGRTGTVFGDSLAWFGCGYAQGFTDSVRIFKTTDMGNSWKAVATPMAPGEGIQTMTFIDSLTGFAGGYGLLKTEDGGETWSVMDNFIYPSDLVNDLVVIPGTNAMQLVATTTEGIVFSVDGGENWSLMNSFFSPGISFADAYSGWTTTYNGVGSIHKFEGMLVSDFEPINNLGSLHLYQVSPNPASGFTTLSMTLAERGEALIKMIDMNGRTIKTLVNGELTPGAHFIPIDISMLHSGYYQIVAQFEGEVSSTSFIKK